jgi:hypothetical protein
LKRMVILDFADRGGFPGGNRSLRDLRFVMSLFTAYI